MGVAAGTIITQMLMDGGSTDRHGATGGHSAHRANLLLYVRNSRLQMKGSGALLMS